MKNFILFFKKLNRWDEKVMRNSYTSLVPLNFLNETKIRIILNKQLRSRVLPNRTGAYT